METLSEPIKLLLNIFDVLGFFTELPPNNFLQKLRYACSVFYVGYFISFTYNEPQTMQFSQALNANMQFFSGFFTYTVIFIDAFTHRRVQRRFWTHVQQFYRSLSVSSNQCKWKRIILKILMLLIAFTLNGLAVTWRLSRTSTAQIWTAIIATRMYQVRIMQYMIYMEIVRGNIKRMRTQMTQINNFPTKTKQTLKKIRTIHEMMWHMVNCLNEIFGYSQVLVVLLCYFLALTNLDWMYIALREYTSINKLCRV